MAAKTLRNTLLGCLLALLFASREATAAQLNEPIPLKEQLAGNEPDAQPLFRTARRWMLDAPDESRNLQPQQAAVVASASVNTQQRQTFVLDEHAENSGNELQTPRPGRPFVITEQDSSSDDDAFLNALQQLQQQPRPDDSFLDEVIKGVAVGRSNAAALRPAVMPGGGLAPGVQAGAGNATKVFNMSSAQKVIGGDHPMELGKVKIRPAHAVLSSNDTLQLECFVGYNTHASVSWTLNDRVLLEVDESKLQTIDYKGVKVMISTIFIRNVLKLPTFKEIYVFKCIYLFDDEMQTAQSVVHARVSDDCQTDKDCAPRNARCVSSRCACASPQYPVKLQSVHTTCRVEAFLETECVYDEQCESVEPKSECTVHHWCACIHGYARDAWSNCLPKNAGLRSRCNSDRDCAAVGANCVLNHCSCLGDAEERGGKCVTKNRTTDELLRRSLVARVTQSMASPQKAAFAFSSTVAATLAHCLLVKLLTLD